MARDPYVHAKEDNTGIREWIAGRGGARTMQGAVPRATSIPPERNDAVAPRLEISPQDQSRHFVLEADNSPAPKPEPVKPTHCGHCGKPLPTLRSAGAEYCNRYCAKAARKARATLLPISYRD
jgi:hypothetical protein